MLKFAQRVNSMKGSAARAMLNITRKPGVISFAGGLPAPELFPVEEYAARRPAAKKKRRGCR